MDKQERMQKLADFLNQDENRTARLLQMSAEDACKEINAEGYDYTAEELKELAEGLDKALGSSDGEIGEKDLENVNGGFLSVAAATAIYIAGCCVAGGATLIKAYGAYRGWWR